MHPRPLSEPGAASQQDKRLGQSDQRDGTIRCPTACIWRTGRICRLRRRMRISPGERHNTMIKSACCKGMPYRPEGNGHIRRRHSGSPGPTRSAAIRRTAIRSAPHDRRTLHVVPRPETRTVPAKRRRYDVPGRRTDPTAVRREARSREHPRKQLRRSRNAAPCRRRIPASSPGSIPAPPALLPASCAPPCPKTAHRRRKCPAGNDVRPDAVHPHGPPCMLPKAHASVQINLAFPPACTIFEAQTTCS